MLWCPEKIKKSTVEWTWETHNKAKSLSKLGVREQEKICSFDNESDNGNKRSCSLWIAIIMVMKRVSKQYLQLIYP